MAPVFLLLLGIPAADASGPTTIPARFEAGLVRVVPTTTDGKTLTLYTDTGGGLFLTEQAVKRLALPADKAERPASAGDEAAARQLVRLPPFKTGLGIPEPPHNDGMLGVMPAQMAEQQEFTEDGMLGAPWFSGRVWTWNYPGQRLTLESADWKPAAAATRVPLGFKTDASGAHEGDFPRITIQVDGQPIDLLLDTGAMTRLTPKAMSVLDDKLPALRATSMVVDTQFQAWRKAHPDWRVIEDAQDRSHAAMIEVPEVEIAGARVGPVWFTWRPDTNFHDSMSRMMDLRVEGALGGNALSHFAMTVDYPGSAAWFECTRDCKTKTPTKP